MIEVFNPLPSSERAVIGRGRAHSKLQGQQDGLIGTHGQVFCNLRGLQSSSVPLTLELSAAASHSPRTCKAKTNPSQSPPLLAAMTAGSNKDSQRPFVNCPPEENINISMLPFSRHPVYMVNEALACFSSSLFQACNYVYPSPAVGARRARS